MNIELAIATSQVRDLRYSPVGDEEPLYWSSGRCHCVLWIQWYAGIEFYVNIVVKSYEIERFIFLVLVNGIGDLEASPRAWNAGQLIPKRPSAEAHAGSPPFYPTSSMFFSPKHNNYTN